MGVASLKNNQVSPQGPGNRARGVLRTFNPELDRKLGGGILLPTLALIEGPNDSGKSVLSYQLCHGALKSSFKVLFVTTEQTVKGLVSSMEDLGYDVRHHFLTGQLRVIELHVENLKWNREVSRRYLSVLLNYLNAVFGRFDVVFVDSLTYVLTHVDEDSVLNFFTSILNLMDNGLSLFVTLHDYALGQDLMIRVRSICDTHVVLGTKEMEGRVIRYIKVLKLRSVEKLENAIIGFQVEPGFGLKVMPFSQARV